MLFATIMSRKKIFIYVVAVILVLLFGLFSDLDTTNEEFSEKIKISLREVGNQLLLSNQDSTSLVLPVVALENSKYELSFQNTLSFEPSRLVTIVKQNLQKGSLPEYYRVEVIQCTDKEVAYSYQMSADEESTIIPCSGRFLPDNCYIIELRFVNRSMSFFDKQTLFYLLLFIVLVEAIFYKRKKASVSEKNNMESIRIGSFQFFPEQNKLVKKATEISLSKKECELLAIFVASPNEVVKRDELTKKVWEDNGVIVGRSLDTYISKLRKKLSEDTSIKLTNVHGVGYKLEV
ncbi:MAG: winged helix-turn-helix transcriptional regulator [Flavobacteriaceae bacterium]